MSLIFMLLVTAVRSVVSGVLPRARTWRDAASRAGLADVSEQRRFGLLTELRGDIDGLGVTLAGFGVGCDAQDSGTRIIVDGRGRIPTGIALGLAGRGARPCVTLAGTQLEIGDPQVDADLRAQYLEGTLLPLLDEQTRRALRAVSWHGQITQGTVRVDVPYVHYEFLPLFLEIALQAARRLRSITEVFARVTTIAPKDRLPRVWLRYLSFLARHQPGDARTYEAFREALVSPDARVRFGTAAALGVNLTAALVACSGIPDPLAEPSLLDALACDDAGVRVFAADELGRVGAAAAVAALHEAARSHPRHYTFPRVAHQAIAAIQERIPGASPGQVSLAEGEAGHVSLSLDEEAGRISPCAEEADAP